MANRPLADGWPKSFNHQKRSRDSLLRWPAPKPLPLRDPRSASPAEWGTHWGRPPSDRLSFIQNTLAAGLGLQHARAKARIALEECNALTPTVDSTKDSVNNPDYESMQIHGLAAGQLRLESPIDRKRSGVDGKFLQLLEADHLRGVGSCWLSGFLQQPLLRLMRRKWPNREGTCGILTAA